jgi:glycyl-tRNA synthetase beta chain
MSKRVAADLLVEIGTEELPPKALRCLMDAFAAGIAAGLDDARLGYDQVHPYASPRRLAVVVDSVAPGQEDREVKQKGPPVSIAISDSGEPTKPGLGFAKKCGVDFADLSREKTKAGEWLTYTAVEPGQPASELLPAIVQGALDALPIPRRMRWGAQSVDFVRPVHWLVLLHGDEVIPGSVLGVSSGRTTRGHRFMSAGEIELASPGDYCSVLEKSGFVLADFESRREKIVAAVANAAKDAGGVPIGDDSLYDEVTGLTEWPVAVTGSFDKEFLNLPGEVIIASLTSHQRYFPVQDKRGNLMPVFITLANLESREPDKVRDGNERVIRPRLADAAFFWKSDQQAPLADRCEALKGVVYQKGLGTLHDKSMRVAALASLLAEQCGADAELVTRAAVLAKCDLLTGMVGEFPELQGTMGQYYAAASDEPVEIAQAIGEQYLPRYAGDELPESVSGQILAVADKLDTLAGIFLLGKKPSGNRDPFGLRRAALGVVRILIEKNLDIDFGEAVMAAAVQQPISTDDRTENRELMYEFVLDRLRSYFVDSGADDGITSDMFEAVRVRRPASLVDFRERLHAVADFMSLEPAVSLAAANKRTANILRKADVTYKETDTVDSALLNDDAERVLYHAMQSAQKDVTPMIAKRAYTDALRRLSELRTPVDAFFDGVMVMTEDDAVRANRLTLLAELRALFLDVADISRLTPAQD